MPGSYSWCSHHVAVVVEHADALWQLRVSHEHHVADICTRCEDKRKFFKIKGKRATATRNVTYSHIWNEEIVMLWTEIEKVFFLKHRFDSLKSNQSTNW